MNTDWYAELMKARAEIERLQQQVSMMQKEIEGYTPWRELQKTCKDQQAEINALYVELNTFKNAVDHVTADGKTSRAFSASEGWAMVHKDRLLDLECAEETNKRLQRENEELRNTLAKAEFIHGAQEATITALKRENEELRADLKRVIQQRDMWDKANSEARTALKSQASEPVAWMYESEPYFDGQEWIKVFEVTTCKQVAYSKSWTTNEPIPLYPYAVNHSEDFLNMVADAAQASEPVAWAVCDTQDSTAIHSVHIFKDEAERHQFGLGSVVPIYLAPPQAEALVADFKRRAVEKMLERETQAAKRGEHAMAVAYRAASITIKSLPLIEGEQK